MWSSHDSQIIQLPEKCKKVCQNLIVKSVQNVLKRTFDNFGPVKFCTSKYNIIHTLGAPVKSPLNICWLFLDTKVYNSTGLINLHISSKFKQWVNTDVIAFRCYVKVVMLRNKKTSNFLKMSSIHIPVINSVFTSQDETNMQENHMIRYLTMVVNINL